jgi:hypothetical protein
MKCSKCDNEAIEASIIQGAFRYQMTNITEAKLKMNDEDTEVKFHCKNHLPFWVFKTQGVCVANIKAVQKGK